MHWQPKQTSLCTPLLLTLQAPACRTAKLPESLLRSVFGRDEHRPSSGGALKGTRQFVEPTNVVTSATTVCTRVLCCSRGTSSGVVQLRAGGTLSSTHPPAVSQRAVFLLSGGDRHLQCDVRNHISLFSGSSTRRWRRAHASKPLP